MSIKNLIGQIHLYIGLIIGFLFTLIAFSGAIYTWAPEISRFIYHENIEPEELPYISIEEIDQAVQREFPQGDLRTVLYRDNSSAVQLLLYGQGTYYHAKLNPYTAEWIHIQDMNKGWLNKIRDLHRNLMLGDFGRQVVHWVSLLSFIMLVTGIILWWPLNKRSRKHKFTIKKRASRKKLNYDLHSVTGFYVTWISIISITTGLFWGFKLIPNTLKAIMGENEQVYDKPLSTESDFREGFNQITLVDSLAKHFINKYPDNHTRISIPHEETDAIHLTLIEPSMLVSTADHYHFDRYKGKLLKGNFENTLHEEVSLYHKIHDLNYDIHFGSVLGLPGRILIFLASLIASFLPITGFIIWYGRRKNSRPR